MIRTLSPRNTDSTGKERRCLGVHRVESEAGTAGPRAAWATELPGAALQGTQDNEYRGCEHVFRKRQLASVLLRQTRSDYIHSVDVNSMEKGYSEENAVMPCFQDHLCVIFTVHSCRWVNTACLNRIKLDQY